MLFFSQQIFSFLVFLFSFWLHQVASGILVPQIGIKYRPPALGAQSLTGPPVKSKQIFWFFFLIKTYYFSNAAVAKSLQSCPTLCDPIDGSPPGSPVPGILQARTLEWAAISFSNAGKWKGKAKSLSHVRLFATPWTAAHQAPLSMGFSRQEYWSGVPLPSKH